MTMKRIFLAALLAIGLSGCAELNLAKQTLDEVTGATIQPYQTYIVINAFGVAEDAATQYANYCRPYVNLTTHRALPNAPAGCSDANRRTVIRSVNAGIAARNQAVPYLNSNTPVPAAIYNTLKTVVANLQGAIAASGVLR